MDKTALSMTTFPPNESRLRLQFSNLFLKQSKSGFQSCLVSFSGLIRIQDISLHLKNSRMRLTVRFLGPKQLKALFEKLILKPD